MPRSNKLFGELCFWHEICHKMKSVKKILGKSSSSHDDTVASLLEKQPLDANSCSITLMTRGIHGFLFVLTCEERIDSVTKKPFLHRVARRLEFCPERNVDRVCGRGKVLVKVLGEDSAKLNDLLNDCHCFPTWIKPLGVLDQILPTENSDGTVDEQEVPIYSFAGDSSNSSLPDKFKLHNCVSWCEEVLKKAGIELPTTSKLIPLKLPAYVVWKVQVEGSSQVLLK